MLVINGNSSEINVILFTKKLNPRFGSEGPKREIWAGIAWWGPVELTIFTLLRAGA